MGSGDEGDAKPEKEILKMLIEGATCDYAAVSGGILILNNEKRISRGYRGVCFS